MTYLRAENQILRSKLPERITLSNQERRKLVRHGKKLGARIKDLILIVSYSTFRKWVRQLEDGAILHQNLSKQLKRLCLQRIVVKMHLKHRCAVGGVLLRVRYTSETAFTKNSQFSHKL